MPYLADSNADMTIVILVAVLFIGAAIFGILILIMRSIPYKKSSKISKLAKHFIIALEGEQIKYSISEEKGSVQTADSTVPGYSISYNPGKEYALHNDTGEIREGKDRESSDDDIVKSFSLHLLLDKLNLILYCIILIIAVISLFFSPSDSVIIVFLSLMIVLPFPAALFHIFRPVFLEYNFNQSILDSYKAFCNALVKATDCELLREKTKAGLTTIIVRNKPFLWLKTNADIFVVRAATCKVIFLPDKAYVIKKGKVSAYDYSDISISLGKTKITEYGLTYLDETIIGKEWKYQTASGQPDRRYKDNPCYNVCLCGEVKIRIAAEHELIIIVSKEKNIDEIIPEESSI